MSNVWQDFSIVVAAGVIVDKLVLAKEDIWALAVQLSSNQSRYSPYWTASLWTIPQLGSSQLMAADYPMGEVETYGIVVGDGQKVSSMNPILMEWLFNRHIIPSGSCLFANLVTPVQENSTKWNVKQNHGSSSLHGSSLAKSSPLMVVIVVMTLSGLCSTPQAPVLFIGSLYVATAVSNIHLATRSYNNWSGITKDTERINMLILGPADRWAVQTGSRGLVKRITTGSHKNQSSSFLGNIGDYLLVMVVLSAGFLNGATVLDGALIALALLLLHLFARLRVKVIHKSPTIRGVQVIESDMKRYSRRVELVSDLSGKEMSDAWAYESGLLTRRYIQPDKSSVPPN